MLHRIIYHPDVKEDINRIPVNMRDKIRLAIENRLTSNPLQYGKPLRKTLKGLYRIRSGDYRIVYKVDNDVVIILLIGHRKDVYNGNNITRRL